MELDIFSFVADRCAQRLAEAGYSLPSVPAEDCVLAYNNVHMRRVPIRPRAVRKADNYAAPPALAAGERSFLADVIAGKDLLPYQSTGLADANRHDAMLFDFGIQHFHMGIEPHPTQPNFRARTDPLLFAMVNDSDFHCIGFFTHGSWSEQGLLDSVYRNWPDLLAPFEIKNVSGLSRTSTNDELARMRKAGVNVFTQRPDGTVHGQPGGGITSAGGSVQSTLQLNQIRKICDDLEQQVRGEVTTKVETGSIVEPGKIEVRILDGNLFAVAPGIQIRLDAPLDPPPL